MINKKIIHHHINIQHTTSTTNTILLLSKIRDKVAIYLILAQYHFIINPVCGEPLFFTRYYYYWQSSYHIIVVVAMMIIIIMMMWWCRSAFLSSIYGRRVGALVGRSGCRSAHPLQKVRLDLCGLSQTHFKAQQFECQRCP